jgi:hypothetical protein
MLPIIYRNLPLSDPQNPNSDITYVTKLPVGGGFVPPGPDMAKAGAVVAARRAAERASERKVCDMIKAPGADALQKA